MTYAFPSDFEYLSLTSIQKVKQRSKFEFKINNATSNS